MPLTTEDLHRISEYVWRLPQPEGHGVPILHLLAAVGGVSALLGRPGTDVDEAALAAALAPMLAANVRSLSQSDLDAIAKAVADEDNRRSAA